MLWAIILFLLLGVGALIFAGYWFDWNWTGFNASIGPQGQQYQPGKTLWDWLNLLGVLAIPTVVGFGVAWFTHAQQQRDQQLAEKRTQDEREAADKRAQIELKIASDNRQETILQEYLNRMSELLLEKNLRASKPGEEVRIVARVRTLTVLRRLDSPRKGTVLQFIFEAGLINGDTDNVVIHLQVADLNRADLTRIFLHGVNLSRANMNEAILHRTILTSAILELTDLKGADLSSADMIRANLSRADLSGANLSDAILIGANLSGANLTEANLQEADLSSANLQGARVTLEQLKTAKLLESATMPDGSKHS